MRADGRGPDMLRPIRFETGFVRTATGSCLASFGATRVICTVTVDDRVPGWMSGRGRGWLTAEYAMLPASTGRRKPRDGRKNAHVDGRTVEIQRLVGRTLRPSVDLDRLGELTLHVDCDVLEADGGTRTCAISGSSVALVEALKVLERDEKIPSGCLKNRVSAVSVGVVDGELLLDLAYSEDSRAESDINVVMDEENRFLEVQGTAEGRPFSRQELGAALDMAAGGIAQILEVARDGSA